MNSDEIINLWEMKNTAVSPTELAAKIDATLKKNPLHAPKNWAEFALTAVSPTAANPDLADIYATLEQAARAYDQIWVATEITSSRWPLINRIKKSFHQLVIFYVNRVGQQQIRFNDRILRTAKLLADRQAARDEELANLKKQIKHLQNQLAEQERHRS